MFERLFRLKKYQTSIRTEIVAGFTTFLSMAYIFFVNPHMLAESGMPLEACFTATILASLIPTLIMGFFANLPIVLAPAMGVNTFFSYTLVQGMGLDFASALSAVFVSGLIFTLIALFNIPALIMGAIPRELKHAVSVGIGFFIALIGFQNAGITVRNEATMLMLGDLSDLSTLLAIFGLVLTVTLMHKKIRGALLWGIVAITVSSVLTGQSHAPSGLSDIVSADIPSIAPIFMKLDFSKIFQASFLSVIFSMTMVDLFNAMGTFIGLSPQLADKENNSDTDNDMENTQTMRSLRPATLTDAAGTLIASCLGSSPVTSYLESITGIAEGGRTGLTAITCALLFAVTLVFAPLIRLIPVFATAPCLILVGALMIQEIKEIDFGDISACLPAFLIIVSMPFTYNIVSGFGLGFMSYCIIQTCTGKIRTVSPVMWLMSLCFLLNFVVG